jgi:hypothetical protein
MELLRDQPLQLVSFDGPLTPGRAVHLLRQACGPRSAHAWVSSTATSPANLMVRRYGGIPIL